VLNYCRGLAALVRNDCTRWILLGGMCRFWQGYTISYYAVKYFNIFDMENTYGILNALSVLIGGFTSNMFAGQVADRYDSKHYRTKSWIGVGMSLAGVPICAICFLVDFNFYFSVFWLFCEYLFCEGWISPNMAMIQTVIDTRYKAVSIGMFLFGTTISGTVASYLVGQLIQNFVPDNDTSNTLGVILAINTTVPCLLASFCFYMAGGHYVKFKEESLLEHDDVNKRTEDLQLDVARLNVAGLTLYESFRKAKPSIRQSTSMFQKKRPLLSDELTKKRERMDPIDEETSSEQSALIDGEGAYANG
jgi:hypothetical protein